MQKIKVDQQAGITKDELLMLLECSGRPNFTKRRLTQFTSRGLLPLSGIGFLSEVMQQRVPERALGVSVRVCAHADGVAKASGASWAR